MGEQETRVAALGREIAELTGLLQRLEDDKREAERQAMTSGHTLRQLESEMTRVRERLSTYERELRRVARGAPRAGRHSSPDKPPSSTAQEEKQHAAGTGDAGGAEQPGSAAPAARRSRTAGQRSSSRGGDAGRAPARRGAHRPAHRGHGVRGLGAPRQAEGRNSSRPPPRSSSAKPRTSGWPSRRSPGLPSANWRRRAIGNCKKNCRQSACAWLNWKRH